jgi:nucleoside phosphorylase
MLDERHGALPNLPQDQNTYTLGRIAKHNVVIACLPKSQIGTTSAASVATAMRISFPSIRFGLMVGIGGGVPSKKNDIRLGDVVIISTPAGTKMGVVQYDFGKTEEGGEFRRTGALSKPPAELLGAVSHLETKYGLEKQLSEHVSNGFGKWFPDWVARYAYQGADCDRLFEAGYNHVKNDDETCQHCSDLRVVADRLPRESSFPIVHYGNIASGNQVMKDGVSRDRLSKLEDIICFEMEAAGLMDNFPCLVIRGICDYADSHKNKLWQPHTAATAAAYAKELLLTVAPQAVQGMTPICSKLFLQVAPLTDTTFASIHGALALVYIEMCEKSSHHIAVLKSLDALRSGSHPLPVTFLPDLSSSIPGFRYRNLFS